MDVVIPIVFPDYLITVKTAPRRVRIPDFLPGIDFLPDVVRIPGTESEIPELGHAGVLFVDGRSGLSKYYEYGRYDREERGLTRRVPVPDVEIASGRPTLGALRATLDQVSRQAGKNGRIKAAYIEREGAFDRVLRYAKRRVDANGDPKREPYGITGNSCVHFMRGAVEAAGAATPVMIDPRPNSYIEELIDDYRGLEYAPSTRTLTIEGWET